MTKRGEGHFISRRELYDLAWSMPATQAGPTLGITGEQFGNICRALKIPRPGRGYWMKWKANTADPPPALPSASRGVADGWKKGDSTEHGRAWRSEPQPQGPRTFVDFQDSRRLHQLVIPAAKALRNSHPDRHGHYLNPATQRLIDMACSKDGLEKCLRFTSDLFKRLEGPTNGYRVSIAAATKSFIRASIDTATEAAVPGRRGFSPSWRPLRPTVVSVLGVSIGLAVVETSRRTQMRYVGHGRFVVDSGRLEDYVPPTWVETRNVPTGLLRITAYSPFYGVPWQRQWTEKPGKLFSLQLDEIVAGLVAGAHELFLALDEAGIRPG
ncbi:hypothetical protein ELH81_15785 [Rhizobium leguminosarum]|uniref:hypothetical protein n=1 Tax=Rhizobium leguminosarum TaxID=384 RepID=UPI0010302674|nr:hypothetical protein [Rhizobium leguminosarum]TAZ15432.1 hypothetical protein ELH81_15785 [Rhizobium leguminosarum]